MRAKAILWTGIFTAVLGYGETAVPSVLFLRPAGSCSTWDPLTVAI